MQARARVDYHHFSLNETYFKPTEFAVILDEVKVVLCAKEPLGADGPSGVAPETQSLWVCSSVSGQKPPRAGASPPRRPQRGASLEAALLPE